MIISSHGHSDVGFVRENNEDSFLVDECKGIYCVADGVGGLPFGNLASRMAVKLFAAMIHSSSDCLTPEELGRYPIECIMMSWSVVVWSEARMV